MTLEEAWSPLLGDGLEISAEEAPEPPDEATFAGPGGWILAADPVAVAAMGFANGDEAARALLMPLGGDILASYRGTWTRVAVQGGQLPVPVEIAIFAPPRRKAVAHVLSLPELAPAPEPSRTVTQLGPRGVAPLLEVQMDVTVVLGTAELSLAELAKLGPDSLVVLDAAAGDPAMVKVQGMPFAWGEVIVLDDQYAIRITELIDDPAHLVEGGGSW